MSGQVDWSFYLQRKNMTLESFLSDVSNIEDAKRKFKVRDLKIPSDDVLVEAVNEINKARIASQKAKHTPKKTVPRKTQSKKSSSKKAPAKPKQTKKSENEEEAPKNAKYFRKVFPKKKK